VYGWIWNKVPNGREEKRKGKKKRKFVSVWMDLE
jgi:hypothetical protein